MSLRYTLPAAEELEQILLTLREVSEMGAASVLADIERAEELIA